MNCRTGEITNDSEIMKLWANNGDRVLVLSEEEAAAYKTDPIVPHVTPEERAAKALRKARCDQLMTARR